MSKTMVIGLTPEYIYSDQSNNYAENEKLYSTNHGAAFITQSIMKIFDGDYIDINAEHDFVELRNTYSQCVIATASQLGPSRDLSLLVSFLEKLDIKPFFVSGGVDAGGKYCINYKLHPSIIRLLEMCSVDDTYIGVRGDLSAFYLHKHGFNSCAPIGCPSIYSQGLLDYDYSLEARGNETGVPFHWALAAALMQNNEKYNYIGQDIFDEELLKGNAPDTIVSKIANVFGVSKQDASQNLINSVGSNSTFPVNYSDWYSLIGNQKRVLSGRLHANICALIQGVASVLVPWDMRTYELVDYLCLPHISWDDLKGKNINDVYKDADFQKFNHRIKQCYLNWVSFNEHNGLKIHTEVDTGNLNPQNITEWKIANRLLKNITQYKVEEKYTQFRTTGNSAFKNRILDFLKNRERI